MSVSDPLLKKLKAYIFTFRTEGKVVEDLHPSLEQFCQTLEVILRKGLKQSNSIFGVTRRDYWNWIDSLSADANYSYGKQCNPKVSMVAGKVKSCKKTSTTTGRGRLFIRLALMHKALISTVTLLQQSGRDVVLSWYDPELSILGDEILSEIFISLLYQVQEISFQFDIANASFLDDSWELPIYRIYEFVPCKDLGIQVQHVDGRPIAVSIVPGGVAEEDNKVEVGDVLEEVLGEPTKDMKLGRMSKLLKQNQGYPVRAAVVKCKLADGSIYPPIGALVQKVGRDVNSLQKLLHDDEQRRRRQQGTTKKPPHALLPEDENEEHPVHSNEGAVYKARYCGRIEIGSQGGVDQIEHAVSRMLQQIEDEKIELLPVLVELGEKDVTVMKSCDPDGNFVLRHSYTEISSCGRRTDCVEYFAYIAGETTCTLAKNFVAYIFLANNNDESKTILCSIAQGFNRTHWFV